MTLTDMLDELIGEQRMDPQLAMKILSNFDRAITETLNDKVKARLTFKVNIQLAWRGHEAAPRRNVGVARLRTQIANRGTRCSWVNRARSTPTGSATKSGPS